MQGIRNISLQTSSGSLKKNNVAVAAKPVLHDTQRGWGPSSFYYGLLFTGILIIAWYVIRPAYYKWVLSGNTVDVVVFCDTTPLRKEPPEAFAMYDRVALSPLAKALGLYQNREPNEVQTFFPLKLTDFKISSYSVCLDSVARGPLSRILFVTSNDNSYYIDVKDRTIRNNKIYVRAE